MKPSSINHRIETRVGSIALSDHGEGTPVLLWPALFSDHRFYGRVQHLLGKGWRSICVDGPGFGQSDPPLGEVLPDTYADVVLDVLDALKIEKAHIAGCSWGGQIAAHVGVRAPHRVRSVLIMNAPLGASWGGHSFEVLGTRWFGAREFWGAGVARSMLARATREAHPERVKEFAAAFRSFEPKAAATTARTVLTRFPGLEHILPHLLVPTTILMGADDNLYPVERMLPLARLAAGARIDVVPSCGHLAPLEAPEAVVSALSALANGQSADHRSPWHSAAEMRD